MQSLKIYLLISFFLLIEVAHAQKGFLRGTIFEDATGETLPGVTVTIVGTNLGTFTDLDGKFSFSLQPGNYSMKISYISFEAITVNDIEVKASETALLDNLRMKEASVQINEVVVTAQKIRSTETAMLSLKRVSVNVMDGISASNFKKIGDSDAASSMKRVPGVSVSGGKYVFVRGLGDRYTKTILNGVDIPGLDPDRNALQMDIFPTNVIDNIIVHKSFSADLPADFTGGIIDIATKDFPEEKKSSISLSGGYNHGSHFNNDYLTYKGGKTDYLGYDDGTREIPATENVPQFAEIIGNDAKAKRYSEILNSFSPTMSAIKEKSFMDYNIGATYGNQIPVSRYTIGYNLAFSYKNNADYIKNAEYGRYEINTDNAVMPLSRKMLLTGDYGTNDVLVSGLGGLAFKSQNSKIRLNLLHLQNGEAQASIFDRNSTDKGSNFYSFMHDIDYNQRSLSNVLLDGKHTFPINKWEMVWKLSPTLSKLSNPDIRHTEYAVNSDDKQRTNPSIGSGESGMPTRIWRDLEEINFVAQLHLTKEFEFRGNNSKLLFGGAYTIKERDYAIRRFNLAVVNVGNLTGNPDELFSNENPDNLWPIDNGNVNGVRYEADFVPKHTNKYNASSNNIAGYISTELAITKKLKTIIGVRAEKFDQFYTGVTKDENFSYNNKKVIDILNFFPSLNTVYNFTENQNFRFSYARTIARPSFKEMSFANIQDPLSGSTFIGGLYPFEDANWSGNLITTDIDNFDLRWELFQEKGQTVSLSTFYKKFYSPIENVLHTVTQKLSIQPRNVGDGQVFGAELEFRQNLSQIIASLDNFSISSNFTFTKSRIKMSKTEFVGRLAYARLGQTIGEYRDMAGQAPYLLNAGMSYNGSDNSFWKGFEAGFYYNVQGQTLYYVGALDNPDVYTMPFHALNFNLNKTFTNKIQIGFKIDNILNQKNELVYKSYNTDDQYFSKIEPGRVFQLRFSYSFF